MPSTSPSPAATRSHAGAAGPILEVRDLTREFKGFVAVAGVTLDVIEGHIHALIGPNGAGKTTFFNLLTRFLSPTSGTIRFRGHDITHEPPSRTARRGLVRSFQISAVFPHMAALENVRVALQRDIGTTMHFWRPERSLDVLNDRAMHLLGEVGLASFADTTVAELA